MACCGVEALYGAIGPRLWSYPDWLWQGTCHGMIGRHEEGRIASPNPAHAAHSAYTSARQWSARWGDAEWKSASGRCREYRPARADFGGDDLSAAISGFMLFLASQSPSSG